MRVSFDPKDRRQKERSLLENYDEQSDEWIQNNTEVELFGSTELLLDFASRLILHGTIHRTIVRWKMIGYFDKRISLSHSKV